MQAATNKFRFRIQVAACCTRAAAAKADATIACLLKLHGAFLASPLIMQARVTGGLMGVTVAVPCSCISGSLFDNHACPCSPRVKQTKQIIANENCSIPTFSQATVMCGQTFVPGTSSPSVRCIELTRSAICFPSVEANMAST
jgi:hypothetical protein